MKFELDGFEIEGSKRVGRFSKFDLFSVTVVATGKHKGRKIRSPEWYSCTLEKALRTIIQQRMNDGKEILDIDSYLKKFEEITEKTNKEINKINTTLKEMIVANEKSLK